MHPKIKVKFLNIIILTSLLFCCKPKNEVEEFKIFPIKPYYFEKIENNNFRNFSTKIKYFMIETNITDTSTLGLKLDTFIKDSIKNEFENFDNYTVWFLKSRKGFDKNYTCEPHDFIDNHGKDLIAVYG